MGIDGWEAENPEADIGRAKEPVRVAFNNGVQPSLTKETIVPWKVRKVDATEDEPDIYRPNSIAHVTQGCYKVI